MYDGLLVVAGYRWGKPGFVTGSQPGRVWGRPGSGLENCQAMTGHTGKQDQVHQEENTNLLGLC